MEVMKTQKIADDLKTIKKIAMYKADALNLPELKAITEPGGTINDQSQWQSGNRNTQCEQNASAQDGSVAQQAVAAQKIKLAKKAEPTIETISELIQAGNKQKGSDSTGKTPLQTDDSGLAKAVADATDAAENPPGVLVDESLEMRAA
ncbi:hypothetical protein DPX39_070007100 [Trypanosoma brucei equiperdum]|uniref:Uncharacterized protein n=1 Tax=Trypanosoma brucei equiperdum TaxID=630700 RepID=A0A3L6L514_9TRYP|nr:hypothetical protein DPX39_070007100 [Trypanosoma brucei equiperdum]